MKIQELALRKADQSICHFRISAIGLDKRGKVVGSAFNRPRFSRKGGGMHAEMNLMNRYGSKISTMIICRTNKTGGILPIDACENCQKRADKLNIKIVSVEKPFKEPEDN